MDAIARALSVVKRADFVPKDLTDQADIDAPLPIGHGQTISQPTTVEMMLEWLEAESGDKVLDVGSGSGWTAALLSYIVGPHGRIYAAERIPELVKFGRENVSRAGIKNVEFFQTGKKYGLVQHAPYDRILVSASAKNLPPELINQLKVGGKLVLPVKNDILEITKTSDKEYEVEVHPGFVFVPLV